MSDREQTALIWQFSAFLMGAALPLKLFGPAVMAVWLILGILFGLLACGNMLLTRELWRELFKSPIFWTVIALLTWLGLSSTQAMHTEPALKRWYDLLGLGVGAGALALVVHQMPAAQVRYMLGVLVVSSLVVAGFTFLDLMVPIERLGQALYGRDAHAPNRAEEFSFILAVMLPWIWVYFLRRARQGNYIARRAGLFFSLGAFVVVFVAGGMAGWAGAIIAATVFLLLGGLWHGVVLHRWQWFSMPVLLFGSVGLYGLFNGWQQLHFKLSHLWQVNDVLQSEWATRLQIWLHGLRHSMAEPFWGIGLNNYRYLPAQGVPYAPNPQNFVIEAGLETGLIGLVLLMALMIMVGLRVLRHAHVNLYALAGLASLTAFVTCSLTGLAFYQPWWTTFFIFISILSMRLCRLERTLG